MSDNKTGAKCLPAVTIPTPLTPVTQGDILRVLGSYCLIRLDNGDEAFYINGQFIHSTEGAKNDPSLTEIARLSARADDQSLRTFELPVPETDEVCWSDIVEQIARSAPCETVRGSVIVTGCRTKEGMRIHFCKHPLLSGINSNLWFPVSREEGWFDAIERILTMNGLAENLTELEILRNCAEYTDWRAIYNRKVMI
ncbi:hypothetical protein [Pantoea ananatis]|uniref:hypothetical protein n=1 Tax=Pantoea ananas TaxID=553 RepID=UPI001FF0CFF1|nr:hypothetical protein [Pantoea ananatis]